MIKHKNLSVVGTSHIAKESIDEVKRLILEEKPAIVALELDKNRLFVLLHQVKRSSNPMAVFKVGLDGYIFSLIGAWAEKKLGSAVGVNPGDEMVQAYKTARKENLQVALIDQDIEITLRRLSKQLTWKEKWRFVKDVFNGMVFKKDLVQIDLSKVPPAEMIATMMSLVRTRYPTFYRVLIDERNHIMANRLYAIMIKEPSKQILAVVGAGHEKELVDLIKSKDSDVTYSFSVSV
jgi:pheromone shutdown-related protein TraB